MSDYYDGIVRGKLPKAIERLSSAATIDKKCRGQGVFPGSTRTGPPRWVILCAGWYQLPAPDDRSGDGDRKIHALALHALEQHRYRGGRTTHMIY